MELGALALRFGLGSLRHIIGEGFPTLDAGHWRLPQMIDRAKTTRVIGM
jgi:hypothetical protein